MVIKTRSCNLCQGSQSMCIKSAVGKQNYSSKNKNLFIWKQQSNQNMSVRTKVEDEQALVVYEEAQQSSWHYNKEWA